MTVNALITGGAGFIGSHIVETLREAGFRVSVLDDLSRGQRAHVPADVTLHHVDICDQGAVEAVVRAERPEVILHQAARADVRESFAVPHLYLNVNVTGTLNILEAARRWGGAQGDLCLDRRGDLRRRRSAAHPGDRPHLAA
ncbi:MAG: hypothetical protein KatS3mg052_1863 [Candidatus Roseilinea sp.]|nr:MAG: hypothetical protein KatS3mg052_1863 [Candidatus Roseilinea sp.]